MLILRCLHEEEQSVTALTDVFDFRREKNEKCLKGCERLNILSFMGKNYFHPVHQRLFQNLKKYFSAYNFTSLLSLTHGEFFV